MTFVRSDVDAPGRPMPRALAVGWLATAALAAVLVPLAIDASLPVLTIVWLAIASLVLRRTRTPAALGLVLVPTRDFVTITIAATVAMTALFAAGEAFTHPYRELVDLVGEESRPDSTFAWVLEHGPGPGLVGFALYGGLVTIFAEEIVFRGALLNRLRRRGTWVAVAGTTAAFAAVQALPAALLPIDAALGFVVFDAVLAVGVVGGLAADRTGSILPGLVAITVANVVVLAAVV